MLHSTILKGEELSTLHFTALQVTYEYGGDDR
jgi:hypothetical protein